MAKGYEQYSNFVLRIGLGLFILIWGLAKFVQKDMWIEMFPMLYWGVAVGAGMLAAIGIFQILLAAMLILGYKVKIAAWAGFVIQLLTTSL